MHIVRECQRNILFDLQSCVFYIGVGNITFINNCLLLRKFKATFEFLFTLLRTVLGYERLPSVYVGLISYQLLETNIDHLAIHK